MNKQKIKQFLLDNYQLVKQNQLTLEQFFSIYKNTVQLEKSDKIAIIQFRALGDAILLSGFIREVKLNNPNKDVVIICDNNNYSIFQYCPYASKVININISTSTDIYQFIENMINILPDYFLDYQFNIVFCTQIGVNNLYAMLCANLVGADNRVGFGANSQQMYLQESYPTPTEWDFLLDNNVLHPKDLYNDMLRKYFLLKTLNYTIHSNKLEIWFNDSITLHPLLKDKKYVVIGLGSREPKKQYPVNQLIEALISIQHIDQSITFVLIGGLSEESFAISFLNNKELNAINLVNKLSILETAKAIQNAQGYIGNDTATIHIAEVFDIPIIGIYAEAKDKLEDNPGLLSSIKRFAPINVSRFILLQPDTSLSPCKAISFHGGCSQSYAHCIKQIFPDKIVRAYQQLFLNK